MAVDDEETLLRGFSWVLGGFADNKPTGFFSVFRIVYEPEKYGTVRGTLYLYDDSKCGPSWID